MNQLEITLPNLHPKQAQIVHNDKRFTIAVCGRRFGKTRAGVVLVTIKALNRKRVWWIAPTYALANEGYLEIKALALQIPGVIVKESDRLLTFPGGGSIQVRTGDTPNNLRGAGLDFVVLDEAAFMHPDVWSQIVRPALADKVGGAAFLSTPNGRNWFWVAYQQAIINKQEWQTFRFPTSDNPYIPAEEIEAARLSTPESTFREEWLAEFLEDEGTVFRKVQDAVDRYKLDYTESKRVVFGLDWAQTRDFTVIAVMDAVSKRVVHVERFNQISWAFQRGRVAALFDKWKPYAILAELNSIGSPNVEALQSEGYPVTGFLTTNESKGQIIQALALAFERDEITIPNDEQLVAELMSFKAERLASGRWKYGAPDGMHDDCVIALSLALEAAHYGVAEVDTQPEEWLEWRG